MLIYSKIVLYYLDTGTTVSAVPWQRIIGDVRSKKTKN